MPTSPQPVNRTLDSHNDRLQINHLLDLNEIAKQDVQDVVAGLNSSPKSIPAQYFYDARGSQLFEAICQLPEYYPTRTEAAILQQYAQEIAQQASIDTLVELGSGSSTKTRYLLDAYQTDAFFHYVPVDVSGSILEESAKALLQSYRQLKIQGQVATYAQALEKLPSLPSASKLVAFLGSSIGNFAPAQCERLLQQITTALNPGDYFLLGLDLQKPTATLEAAYNDAQEVTAAFNLNMLRHLNQRFSGNFNLDLFCHQAVYNSQQQQIEMYLISQQPQTVTLKNLDLTIEIASGEKILTEISRKFQLQQMQQYLSQYGLNPIATYTDERQWFGLLLLQFAQTNN